MIAAHLDNLLFLLLVAVAVLFQLLAKAAAKAGKNRNRRTSTATTPPPIPHTATESDEERIRKLLEALGQPPTSKPPPPIVPRTDVPPRPLAPVRPPISPLSQVTREKRRRREMIREEIPQRSRTVGTAGKMVLPAFEVQEGPFPIAPQPVKAPSGAYAGGAPAIAKTKEPTVDMATLLASTSGLRGAIILREILGPPRGLRMQMEFSDRI